MVPLHEQVGVSIADRRLFSPRQHILVAVSGGVDSMVLLHILAGLSREHGWKLTIGHLNHQLRGVSSLADERLVLRTARKLNLPIVVSRADVRGFAKAGDLSVEMGARKLRHDFLAQSALERNIPSISLAHHLDDQIELFFLRLFRGGGSQGLAGMKWSNPSPNNRAINLVRPLLECPKSALHEYALEHGIRFREDATNCCLDIQRNRIRHELLPLLREKYQPAVNETISRFMDILNAESEYMNALAEFWLKANLGRVSGVVKGQGRLRRFNKSRPVLPADLAVCVFERLPIAMQRRCVQLQLIRQGIAPSFDLVEHLRLCPCQPIELGPDCFHPGVLRLDPKRTDHTHTEPFRLVRDPGGVVRRSLREHMPFRHGFCQLDLRDDRGRADWEGVRFAWQIHAIKGLRRPGRAPGTELFDADKVGPAVILRHWRPGDRFQPIGMEWPVKLQDLFVNQKVPKEQRRQLAVAVTEQGDLFWVQGLRISERFKLTRSTIRRLHWAWQKL